MLGIKILGEGALANQLEMAIQHAVRPRLHRWLYRLASPARPSSDQIAERISAVGSGQSIGRALRGR